MQSTFSFGSDVGVQTASRSRLNHHFWQKFTEERVGRLVSAAVLEVCSGMSKVWYEAFIEEYGKLCRMCGVRKRPDAFPKSRHGVRTHTCYRCRFQNNPNAQVRHARMKKTKMQQRAADLTRKVWEDGDGVCCLCLEPVALWDSTVEHNTPRCRGGTDDPSNLGPAHFRCNAEKGKLTIPEYRAWQEENPTHALRNQEGNGQAPS